MGKKNIKINKNKELKLKKELDYRILKVGLLGLTIFIILLLRIAYIQFINGKDYKERAYKQQTASKVISPNRGTIYDSTGKALAISATVDTVTVNPNLIVVKDSNASTAERKTNELRENLATAFSEIFELEYETVLDKLNSSSSLVTIAKKVEQDKINKLKTWMKENKFYSGINIDEDYKRYYPYGTFASNLIGFCGDDNQGLEGLEDRLDNILTGTAGRVVTSVNSLNQEIPDENQMYYNAENGCDVVLSIDYNIQSIAEKYLKQAVNENKCESGGNIIIMDPSTGDILAMVTYPNYDLNTPFIPNSSIDEDEWSELSSTDKSNFLYRMWRNKAVSDTYEPGSTFKLLMAAIGLEEDIVEANDKHDFLCTGKEDVYGTKIKCWRSARPHGYQSLADAICNSCNPAFMQLGKMIGVETLYKYFEAFGLFNTTGAQVSGEVSGIFHDENEVGPVELATLSFGQRFAITPLQLITAVSSLANNGYLMEPRIVKQIINTDTNVVTNIEPVKVRQVVSEETCEEIKDMMESVVSVGTGIYSAVEGYSIGGKTGTSEPSAGNSDSFYVASFVGIAPIEDPKLSILVTLYDPQGNSHEGGTIAAPVVSQILSEVLPYLGIASDSENDDEDYITVPDIRNKTVTEAIKTLEKAGFSTNVNVSENKNEILVTDQVPKPGTPLIDDSIVCLYTDENDSRTSVKVPNLKGMTLSQAIRALKAKNLNITYEGYGTVISQDITADTSVEIGSIIKVILKNQTTDLY